METAPTLPLFLPAPKMGAKAVGCCPQADGNALLWKTTPNQLTEHRNIELVLT